MVLDLRKFYQACNPSKTLNLGNAEDRQYYIDFSNEIEDVVDEMKNEKQQLQAIEAKMNQVLKQRLRLVRTLVILLLGSTISAV